MKMQRVLRHLLLTGRQLKRAFPRATLTRIEHAIQASENTHLGEVRFAVEGALDGWPLFNGQSARDRAVDLFSQLRVWDTQHNTGLLVYVLLADRAVEIVADRGIHAKVGSEGWNNICRQMESAFRQANFEGGVVEGVHAITQHLVAHFPAGTGNPNELPDGAVVM